MHLNYVENSKYLDSINEMDKITGRDWIKYSVSVWDDCKKSEEKKFNHPASFPVEMVEKLIRLYSKRSEIVMDPFAGIGSTLVAATKNNRRSIGFEINSAFISTAEKRLVDHKDKYKIINDSCLSMNKYISNNSIDFCITSPPYWDILNRTRTADKKEIRNYGDDSDDLGNINNYDKFLNELYKVFKCIYDTIKFNKHCVLIVMDIRKKSKFYPFHIDITNLMNDIGFQLEDFIIWDRKKEYNNLKPLGYPYVFRVNKVHEYICIFKKTGVSK